MNNRMKTNCGVRVAALAVVGVVLLEAMPQASAGPDSSPSARSAARLKYNPPHNWLRHYLGDDRYKIGSAWQVVSTETDTDYHRADCPLMLRQSPDGVIGFPTSALAVEAGYKSCPICHPAFTTFLRPTPTRPVLQRPLPGALAPDEDTPLTPEEEKQVAAYNQKRDQWRVDVAAWFSRKHEIEAERNARRAVLLAELRRDALTNGGHQGELAQQFFQIGAEGFEPPPREPVAPEAVTRRTTGEILRLLHHASAAGQ